MSKSNDDDLDLLESVEKSPRLTNYVIRNKTSEIKKTAIIISLLACFLTFAIGFVIGMNIFSITQTKSIVEVQVSKD